MFSTLKTKKTFPTCRNQHLDFVGENWCLIRHIHTHVSSVQNKFILFSLSRIVALCLILSFSINELNGYFCPKQINNSSVPFRPEIPLKRNSKLFSTMNRIIVLFFSYHCSPLTTERAPLSVIQMTWLTFIWIPLNPICDFAPLAEGQTRS